MRITTVRQQTILAACPPLRLVCPVCEREVEMLTNAEAVRVLGVDNQTFGCLVAAGRAHCVQTISGRLWVCKESLFLK